MRLTIDERDHIVDIRGDREQSLGRGYACFKGLQAEEAHHGAARLLHPLKRTSDRTFKRVPLREALDEIGSRIKEILDRRGGNAVGVFAGGGSIQTATAYPMQRDFLAAICSRQYFSTVTIDQSAKIVSFERLGGWAAGVQDLRNSEVVMLFGTNPLLSHSTVGLMSSDPTRRLKRAKADGLVLICIDPRRSETARHAQLFLQPLPGHDAQIAAALIRIILNEGWHDAAFCARYVGADRLAALRDAVDSFTPEMVEDRAGLESGQLRAAAVLFARDHSRGAAFTATGPSMAPFSNLMQHLVDCLNVICGRFRRAGDRVPVDPLAPSQPIYAEVIAPPRSFESVPPSRIRGAGLLYGERLTSTLAEEILTPGDGQIRCLIVDGGNVANCVPDQRLMVEALKSLDLLVVIDPYMTVSAQLAHFVLPPPMMYERPDLPLSLPGFPLYPDSWTQYTPAHLRPPGGSELVDDWRFFWEIAARLGKSIIYDGKVALDMKVPPTSDELLAIQMRDAAISLDELKRYPSGVECDFPFGVVQPERDGANAQFDVMPADVAAECARLLEVRRRLEGNAVSGRPFTHLLASRRLRDVFNSTGTRLTGTLRRRPYNPAFLNPADMAQLQLESGDPVEISSSYGMVVAIAQSDPELRRGVVSLSHGWGGYPGETEGPGSAVNVLTSCRENVESINAMPVMSAIPVSISRAKTASGRQLREGKETGLSRSGGVGGA